MQETRRGTGNSPLSRALPAEIDFAATLIPAKAVGGDLYDAFMLDARRFFFISGDVSGKGVPAALFMALSKAFTKSAILRSDGDLAAAVEAANHDMSRENAADLFLAALIAIVDIETGEVEFCCAGHENPLLLDENGSLSEIALEGGPPLCTLEDYPYPVEKLQLAQGAALVIATDGATEARSPTGALFGRKRLFDLLAGVSRTSGAKDIVEIVVNDVRQFEDGAPASDDLTVVVLRYLGKS